MTLLLRISVITTRTELRNPLHSSIKYNVYIARPFSYPDGYPLNPKAIGEHIRKKRMDGKLMQSDIAHIIGVSEGSIWNWENGTQPHVKYVPNIIKFIGYIPFKSPENGDAIDRLRYFKLINGLTIKQLAKNMGRSQEQLADWINGRTKPYKKNLEIIDEYVSVYPG